MRLRKLATMAAIGSFAIACGSSVTQPGQQGDGTRTYVRGGVSDTAFRPLPGTRMEILDGRYAGATTSASESGFFEFSGTVSGRVRLRASRPGFETATLDATWGPATAIQWAQVRLKPIEPALTFQPGPYTLTITTDLTTAIGRIAPCEGFPADLTTRTFEGTISVSTAPTHAYEFVAVPSPTLNRYSGTLWLGVAGQFVGFESDDPLFAEELPGFRYLQIMGNAPTSVPATSTGTSITVPFHGDFWYCQTTSAMNANNCSQVPQLRADYRSCSSVHDTMVFTKR